MKVRCGSCGTVARVGNEHAGKVVACPSCGEKMQLPAAGAAAAKSGKKKPARASGKARAPASAERTLRNPIRIPGMAPTWYGNFIGGVLAGVMGCLSWWWLSSWEEAGRKTPLPLILNTVHTALGTNGIVIVWFALCVIYIFVGLWNKKPEQDLKRY